MKYFKKMTGSHIYLSPVTADETDCYLKWLNDPAVAVPFGQYPKAVPSRED